MRLQLREAQLTADALLFYGSILDGLSDYHSLFKFANRIFRLIKDSWPKVSKAALEEKAADGCRIREAARNLKFVDSMSLSAAIDEIRFQQQNREFYCVNEVRAESFEYRVSNIKLILGILSGGQYSRYL